MTTNFDREVCEVKKQYPTFTAAAHAARHLRFEKKWRMEPYRCKVCQKWHNRETIPTPKAFKPKARKFEMEFMD